MKNRSLAMRLAFVLPLLTWLFGAPAIASQASCVMPTTGTVSGLTLVNDINACNGSLLSLYSGASAPASPTTGMLWYNTTSNYVQQYDGTSWLNLWFVDATNHLSTADIGGGITSRTITAAATTDIGSVPQSFITVNGTTTITSLGTSAKVGSVHVIVFNGVLTLTSNSTSLIIPGVASKTTAAGDVAIALYLGSGNWRVLDYAPLLGQAVVVKVQPAQKISASGTYTPTTGMIYVQVECVGGGGGGGGIATSTASGMAGGGGSGGYSRVVLTAAAVGVSKAITIGAAGAQGAAGANNGTAGGDTSLGTLCVAKGGGGGGGATAPNPTSGGGGGLASGGTGDVKINGNAGSLGSGSSVNTSNWVSGPGAPSFFGGGATGAIAGGANGTDCGGGASGGAGNATGNLPGGTGAAGCVVITEFTNQ